MTDTTLDSALIGSALADAVERVAPSVLHVDAGGRLASGVVWSPDEQLVVTPEDALASVHVIEAAYRSLSRGEWEPIRESAAEEKVLLG